MNCRLTQNIKHSCNYNPGGITNIYLLDIRNFINYVFANDGAYTSGYVDDINSNESFVEIDCTVATSFSETADNGLYKQSVETFINALSASKLASLLSTWNGKYLVAFRNRTGQMFCFGSDGGASVTFSQQTGQTNEGAGYMLTFSKQSIYPLFETNPQNFNKVKITEVLGTEDLRIMTTQDFNNAIIIKRNHD